MTRVVVKSKGQNYTQEIVAGRHRLMGDEPVASGGQDLGPTPYQFLLSSIGTCTSITLQMYAGRKNWPLEAVEVSVEGQHLRNGKDAEYEILVSVGLTGPLSPEQRDRLLAIAGRCPVTRTLAGEIRVQTRLDTSGGH